MPALTERDGVHVLHIGDGENRFTLDWMKGIEDALDEVEASPAPLVTVASGKHYSNGLDLEWVLANMGELQAYAARVEALLGRVLTLGVPTAAGVSGHAFGAGAILAMAHDWRVMRSDRGYFCFPEVDIPLAFPPGLSMLVQAKLTPRAATDAMITGHRFTAPEALAAGIVDGIADEAAVLGDAIARVTPHAGKDPNTLESIKRRMYSDVISKLSEGAHW
ncbi:MAG: enoyl-CoA hydratase-related protein [Conexibacteraceae bacterium]|nr:enoyl-CoA hydratase-related protein [Conexibacteraceae bacterium]